MTAPATSPIGSAVGRLLAVFDTVGEAEAARTALISAGTESERIEIRTGPAAAAAFAAGAGRRGWRGRLFRVIELTWADQATDFAWYEAAVREGHTVLSARVRGQPAIRSVADIVVTNGGHFINHFGWFETQELARWRGPEPDVPAFVRR